MQRFPVRSILVASDLGERSDALVRSAAALASVAGAELHVLHVLELEPGRYGKETELSFPSRHERAEETLAEQVRRAVPEGVPVKPCVMNYAAHRAITEQAEDLRADLIVLGAHRREGVLDDFLGSTADRVIRAAKVPCLVLRGPLSLPLRRVGVPVDFSDPATGALHLAHDWASALDGDGGAGSELRVLHVESGIEEADAPASSPEGTLRRLEREVEAALPEGETGVEVRVEVRRELSPSEGIVSMAREEGLDLLVMGTHGRGGLQRLLIGSVASQVARRAPCPVLLVPPSLARRAAEVRLAGGSGRLERTLVAVDFSEASVAAASWAARHFLPGAEHHFVHVLHVKEPPAYLGGPTADAAREIRGAEAEAEGRLRGIARELGSERVSVRSGRPAEVVAELAAEERADLVVVGPHARGGLAGWLGSTAEDLIASSRVPVLLAREMPAGPPTRILAAVDASEGSREVLAWARALRERFGSPLGALLAVEVLPYQPAFELVGHAPITAPVSEGTEEAAAAWLRGRATEAGLSGEEVQVRVGMGDPANFILGAAEEERADLIVMGSRGAGTAGRFFLGSVARTVLRRAPCPVFVVGNQARVLGRG